MDLTPLHRTEVPYSKTPARESLENKKKPGAEIEDESWITSFLRSDMSSGLGVPVDDGIEGDTESEEEEDPAPGVTYAQAAPHLKALAEQMSAQPDLADPRLAELIKLSTEIAQDAARRQEKEKPPALSISAVRDSLIKRSIELDRRSELRERASPNDKQELDFLNQCLGVLDQIDHLLVAHASVPSAGNERALSEGLKSIDTSLRKLDEAAIKMVPGKQPNPAWKTALDDLKLKRQQLKEIQREFANYESPNGKRRRLEERLLYLDAAISAMKDIEQKADTRDKTAATHLIRLLEERRKAINAWLKDPARALAITGAVDLREQMLKGSKDAFGTVLLDEKQQEQALMKSVLEQFLARHPGTESRSAGWLLKEAKGELLNRRRSWDEIKSTIRLPLGASNEKSDGTPENIALASLTAATLPAGHIFGKPSTQSLYKSCALTNADMLDYLSEDASGKKRINGVNSHSTVEYRHGVNVAHTSLKSGEKTLFSGTRHATLSAYDLYPDTMRKKSDGFLRSMHDDLCRDISRPTHLCTDRQETNIAVQNSENFEFKSTELDRLWTEKTQQMTQADFVAEARRSDSFCKLLRRKAGLNRAREVFLAELLSKPALQQRVADGKPITFTSISLITPDPFRQFLGRIFPSLFRKNDELTMRQDELQAWKDLQASIDQGQLIINNQPIKATIVPLCVGVNQIAQTKDWGPLGRWLLSGWRQSEADNRAALTTLIGDPDSNREGGRLSERLREINNEQSVLRASALQIRQSSDDKVSSAQQLEIQEKILDLDREAAEIRALDAQLRKLWQTGQYRHAGSQPYKFAARLARMAELLGSGLAFNCKSGKDRTAQLDLEAKLLSVQSTHRRHQSDTRVHANGSTSFNPLVPHYDKRSPFELQQMQAFVFQDQTRTAMQRYNTGVEGSKLTYWQQLYESFVGEDDDAEFIGNEFRGRSEFVPS